MRDDVAGVHSSNLSRRDFFGVGALPLVTGIGAMRASVGPEPLSQRMATSQPGRSEVVRVGIIGAGNNVRTVQIPNFRRISDCEIIAVANRSLESSQRVADEFDIPRAYGNWKELLDDEDVDAVLIGTWPYMHHPLTLASLDKGKHVLCQARMANNAQEAREMLAASHRHPDLVCQLVPTSTSYRVDNLLRRMIDEGVVGEILSAEVQRLGGGFADFQGPLDWRRDREFSGFNTMNLGSTYESTMRWLGRGNQIIAMSSVHVAYRRGPTQELRSVSIPDHVDVLYRLANGAQVHMRFSETTGLSDGNQTWIHGTEGTIHIDGAQNVFAGHRGDASLSPVPNPPEGWAPLRVEEEFINAIRGVEEVTMLPFEAGAHYMEWTEAVHRSAQSGEVIYLPL